MAHRAHLRNRRRADRVPQSPKPKAPGGEELRPVGVILDTDQVEPCQCWGQAFISLGGSYGDVTVAPGRDVLGAQGGLVAAGACPCSTK